MAELLHGKKGLIMGIANDRSIAAGIAESCIQNGAEIAITYQDEILLKRVAPLAAKMNCDTLIKCDVSEDVSLDTAFAEIESKWGELDFIVHSIAFANKDELSGGYINTSRSGFVKALDVSCYSFTAVAKRAMKLMKKGGSMLTLTYYGAEKFIPNYNVMGVAKAALEASLKYLAVDLGEHGIRVNAISAGPIRTLAASGIDGIKDMLAWTKHNTPLRQNVTIQDVGSTAVYLLSDLSHGVTGEIIHVDGGYHVMGMKLQDNPA